MIMNKRKKLNESLKKKWNITREGFVQKQRYEESVEENGDKLTLGDEDCCYPKLKNIILPFFGLVEENERGVPLRYLGVGIS